MKNPAYRLLALALLACLLILPAQAQGSLTLYDKIQVPLDAQLLDLGETRIVNLDKLRGYLNQLPNLTEVRMPQTRVSLSQLEALQADYPNITFLCQYSLVRGVLSTSQTAFSTLNSLADKRYPESRFVGLRHSPGLLALDLGHNQIEDLSFLRALPGLRVLILADNHITDLGPLADLPDLEYIELFMNRFTDLSPLAGLSKLRDLNLCRNQIEDITPLLGLTQLERLWLPDNFLSAEQKQQLEAALPDTRIQYEWSRSTDHGWRKHPRYDILFRMFKSGVYAPFPQERQAY